MIWKLLFKIGFHVLTNKIYGHSNYLNAGCIWHHLMLADLQKGDPRGGEEEPLFKAIKKNHFWEDIKGFK